MQLDFTWQKAMSFKFDATPFKMSPDDISFITTSDIVTHFMLSLAKPAEGRTASHFTHVSLCSFSCVVGSNLFAKCKKKRNMNHSYVILTWACLYTLLTRKNTLVQATDSHTIEALALNEAFSKITGMPCWCHLRLTVITSFPTCKKRSQPPSS